MRFVPILILLTFRWLNSHSQTCVVAKIQNNDTIFLGADTRVSHVQFNETKKKYDTINFTGAKLFNTSRYFYGVSGLMIETQASIADSIFKLGYPSEQSVLLYQKAFFNAFISHLSNFKLTTLEEITQKEGQICETTVCLFDEKSSPIIWTFTIGLENPNSNDPRLVAVKSRTVSDSTIVNGFNDHAGPIKDDPSVWKKGGVNGIRTLISLEADKHQLDVSRPIDIFVITRNSHSLTRY
jgi:hypothetical protein